jgi:hypothetical protein
VSNRVTAGNRRRVVVGGAAVVAALVLVWSTSGERGAPLVTASPILAVPPDSEFAGVVELERRAGPWLVRVIHDTASDERVFDLSLNGRRAWAVRAADIHVLYLARDITGDDVPDVVVEQFSGGMHCCIQTTVLGLGAALQVHGTIYGGDGDVEFEDLDRDGAMEARVGDWRFAYWREYAFVETQVPEVILRFTPQGYRPACDLMATPPPDSAALSDKARELSDGWTAGDPPPELWGYAVELVYQGHARRAWRFLDLAWPPSIPGKHEFVRDLRSRLQGSPCWSEPPSERRTA